ENREARSVNDTTRRGGLQRGVHLRIPAMHASALRALEFDRIVSVVTGLAVTPTGRDRLADLHPMIDASRVGAAQRATSEGVRFLAEHAGFPLRAPSDLEEILDALTIEGRPLEPLRLFGVSDTVEP